MDINLLFLPVEMIWFFWDRDSYYQFSVSLLPMAMAKTVTALPLGALCLVLTGATPGKALLASRVEPVDGEGLGFTRALKRSLYAFWLGSLGFITPVGYIFIYFSYNRLRMTHSTGWDARYRTQVVHRPLPGWRMVIFALAMLVLGAVQSYMMIASAPPELLESFFAALDLSAAV